VTAYDARTISRWEAAVRPHARPITREAPAESALLVVDMQEHFASIAEPIVSTVRDAVIACRALGVGVVFTQHGHTDPAADGGRLGEWWGDLIEVGTREHPLLEGAGAHDDDLIIPKTRYSAFFDTDLDDQLRALGIRSLAIAGVMTNLCVETTARDAFMRDYRVHVLLDATATADESMHLASLINLAFGFAHVETARSWIEGLGGRTA